MFGDEEVGQCEQGVELAGVFVESPISDFAVVEEVFDDVEGVFNSGTYLGFEFLDSLGEFFKGAFGHLFNFASSLGNVP